LLLASFLLIGIAVVACATPQGSTPYSSGSNGNVFQTPASLESPTPAFPPFTVGAWPSNYSPGNNGTLTIYVECRIQDPSMQNPATPAKNVPVIVNFASAGNAAINIPSMNGQTASDGIAAFTFSFTDPYSGVPVVVQVIATYNGVSYPAQTFFTPNPEQKPTPSVTASPSASPSASATP
jgi:hypothetical protein